MFQALHAPLEAAGEKRADIRDGAQPAAGSRSERAGRAHSRQPRRAAGAAHSRQAAASGGRSPQPAAAASGGRSPNRNPKPPGKARGSRRSSPARAGRTRRRREPQRPARSEEAAQAKAAPRRKHRAACAVLAVAALLAAGGVGYSARLLQENLLAAAEPVSVERLGLCGRGGAGGADLTATEADGSIGILRLANTQHPLPDGYVPPNLETMDGEGPPAGRACGPAAARHDRRGPRGRLPAGAQLGLPQLRAAGGAVRHDDRRLSQPRLFVRGRLRGHEEPAQHPRHQRAPDRPCGGHRRGPITGRWDDGYAETDEAKWLVEARGPITASSCATPR